MKKLLLVLGCLLWLHGAVSACEGCGCSIGSNGIGLVSAFQFNTVGTRWSYIPFRSSNTEFGGTQDYFHRVELRIQYHLSPKLRVELVQPYQLNAREDYNGRRLLDGWGDTRLSANYALLNNIRIGSSSKLYFEAGLGLKSAFGQYKADLHLDDFPENFNPGNGSWGYIGQSRLVYTRGNWGLSASTFYQRNGKTAEGYRFGDQWANNLLVFWQKTLSDQWQITPFGGWSFEKVAFDYNNRDRRVQSTSGNGQFLTAGFNLQFARWLLASSYAIPIKQSYSEGDVVAKNRFSVELSFLF
ncbi:MAG: hypothetical protein AAFV95_25705 [Bacteroidota bacterium]